MSGEHVKRNKAICVEVFEKGKTMKSVAVKFNLSYDRIRQICAKYKRLKRNEEIVKSNRKI